MNKIHGTTLPHYYRPKPISIWATMVLLSMEQISPTGFRMGFGTIGRTESWRCCYGLSLAIVSLWCRKDKATSIRHWYPKARGYTTKVPGKGA